MSCPTNASREEISASSRPILKKVKSIDNKKYESDPLMGSGTAPSP